MVILTIKEIFDIIFMTVIIGLIFMNFFQPKKKGLISQLIQKSFFNKQGFISAIIIIAPAIILHEFGHKFTAMAFGLSATFNAAYGWLIFALILRFVIPGFVFLVPAYVSILGDATPLQYSLVAFAGPLVNIITFGLVSLFFIYAKHKKMQIKKNIMMLLLFTKKINLFLFIFNMLPLPGFDGFHVFSGLIKFIF
jgi:Zn-dependent protease